MRKTILAFALLATSAAEAADHGNLETNFPLVIEDAYPVGRNGIEAQLFARGTRLNDDPEGDGLSELAARIEWGAFRNFQIALETPYRFGSGSAADSGTVAVEALYNFNTETLSLPAFSVAAGLERPYGQDGEDGGLEASIGLLSTLSLGTSGGGSPYAYVPRQLHFNATYIHNFDPLGTERTDRYLVGIGYSQPVTNDLVLVGDLYRETDREEDRALNMVELGGRYVITPHTIVSAGIGVGFGPDRTEDARLTLGVQHAMSFPYLGAPR
ncbi:hypothetical protein [uncultured Jannaschia sp.]|uniref:hypothetical protein n=1 Tax=uncultured Jannaschia sp. TaxID=293347 RepID=UPI002636DBFD|nr:hypothetical protein [uncultured Jannaschia sp.]